MVPIANITSNVVHSATMRRTSSTTLITNVIAPPILYTTAFQIEGLKYGGGDNTMDIKNTAKYRQIERIRSDESRDMTSSGSLVIILMETAVKHAVKYIMVKDLRS